MQCERGPVFDQWIDGRSDIESPSIESTLATTIILGRTEHDPTTNKLRWLPGFRRSCRSNRVSPLKSDHSGRNHSFEAARSCRLLPLEELELLAKMDYQREEPDVFETPDVPETPDQDIVEVCDHCDLRHISLLLY